MMGLRVVHKSRGELLNEIAYPFEIYEHTGRRTSVQRGTEDNKESLEFT